MRAALIVFATLAATVAAGLLALYFMVVKPVERALAPTTSQTSRIDILAAAPDAVILMPFVTGDVPRLVRGETLVRLTSNLWFTDNTDAGNVIGAVLFGLGGMPPTTDLAIAFKGGVAIRRFTCLTVGCVHWPSTGADTWGLGRLRRLGDALGPEVRRRQETFSRYDAYTAAHAAVAADPRLLFADPGAETLQPPPNRLRLMVVALPTRLEARRTAETPMAEDAVVKAELENLAAALLKGSGGRLEAALGADPMLLWATRDDQMLRDAQGGTRALPDLVQFNPTLRLMVPEDRTEAIGALVKTMTWPAPDRARIDAALARAFLQWGVDNSCLPVCGGINPTHPFVQHTEVTVANPPFWTVDVWVSPGNVRR
jgi:hypothetical protein